MSGPVDIGVTFLMNVVRDGGKDCNGWRRYYMCVWSCVENIEKIYCAR